MNRRSKSSENQQFLLSQSFPPFCDFPTLHPGEPPVDHHCQWPGLWICSQALPSWNSSSLEQSKETTSTPRKVSSSHGAEMPVVTTSKVVNPMPPTGPCFFLPTKWQNCGKWGASYYLFIIWSTTLVACEMFDIPFREIPPTFVL